MGSSSGRKDANAEESDERPAKRPADALPQPRKKRGRYTLNACDECKRRKTKCTGETPCQLCRSIGETCEYSRETGEEVTQKYMNSAIQSLQRQIGELSSIVNSLRNEGIVHRGDYASVDTASTASPSPHPPRLLLPAPEPPPVVSQDPTSLTGPTTSSYAFNLVDKTLNRSGVTVSAQPSAPASPPLTEADAPERYHEMASADDPLTAITPKDMIRYLKLWEEELGLQIPHLEVDRMLACVNVHAVQPTPGRNARYPLCSGKCYIQDDTSSLMRSVVAIVLLLEDHRNRPIAKKLMDRLSEYEGKRYVEDTKIETDELSLVVMKSIYYFLEDNERLAWRLMGFAARMCLEIGLHRKKNLANRFPTMSERRRAVKLFWCVYVLERRWSFGAGLPPSINESDVDQRLEDGDIASLYLRSMKSYCTIASQVWSSTANASDGTHLPSDHDCSYMEFLVLEWRRSLPNVLQFTDPYGGFDARQHNRGHYRLQVLQYLRGNQMRVLIHRPFLFSKQGINDNLDKVRKAIEVAKDSIRVLKRLHETSTIYSRQHMVFNHYLDSALAVLLLAVCNEPKGMADLVRKDIGVALELVHNLASRSPISKRLWNRLKKYREIPRRLSDQGSKKPKHSQFHGVTQHGAQKARDPARTLPATSRPAGEGDPSFLPTPTMSDTSSAMWDPELAQTYDSLFGGSYHNMLDNLRGSTNEWAAEFAPDPTAMSNLPNTWASNDPTAYPSMVAPVGTVATPTAMFAQQMDHSSTPGSFGDISDNLFSF